MENFLRIRISILMGRSKVMICGEVEVTKMSWGRWNGGDVVVGGRNLVGPSSSPIRAYFGVYVLLEGQYGLPKS